VVASSHTHGLPVSPLPTRLCGVPLNGCKTIARGGENAATRPAGAFANCQRPGHTHTTDPNRIVAPSYNGLGTGMVSQGARRGEEGGDDETNLVMRSARSWRWPISHTVASISCAHCIRYVGTHCLHVGSCGQSGHLECVRGCRRVLWHSLSSFISSPGILGPG